MRESKMALCKVVNRVKMFRVLRDFHVSPSFREAKNSQKLKKLAQSDIRREFTAWSFSNTISNESSLDNLRLDENNCMKIAASRKMALSAKSNSKENEPSNNKFPKPERKKTTGPRITLLSTDDSITVLTLEEAQKLSKRRDLKLVKIQDLDTKTQRPLYKLMTGSEFFELDKQHRSEKVARKEGAPRSEKLITFTNRISEHDLSSKIKNMNKWLTKRHEVRVVINGDGQKEASYFPSVPKTFMSAVLPFFKNIFSRIVRDAAQLPCGIRLYDLNTFAAAGKMEQIFSIIESGTKAEGKLVQKRWKGYDIRFQIVPLKKEINPNSSDVNEEPTSGAVRDSTETKTVSSI